MKCVGEDMVKMVKHDVQIGWGRNCQQDGLGKSELRTIGSHYFQG